ncbi:MAG: hypothetical protein WC359_13780 [Dehalococcoidia bacterium]
MLVGAPIGMSTVSRSGQRFTAGGTAMPSPRPKAAAPSKSQ